MNKYDVIIIGGSNSGLAAALTLGRSLRNILVIDNGKPCNRFTPHSHNFLTQDGKSPKEIIHAAKMQISKYETVRFLDGEVVSVFEGQNNFEVHLNSNNEKYHAKKIIFATGLKDSLPEIEGLKECWGISAVHCPYCHGYEFREKRTGILADDPAQAFHYAQLVRNLTKDVIVFTDNPVDFLPEQLQYFDSHNIEIVENRIRKFEHASGYIQGFYRDDEKFIPLDAVYVKPDCEQSCKIPENMGCEISSNGFLVVDSLQKTNIPGVFACGDNSSPFRSVSSAVAAGSLAGASANMELCMEL